MNTPVFLIDGGTTNVRVTLLDRQGLPLDTVKKEAGVAHTAMDGHNGRLKEAVREAISGLTDKYGIKKGENAPCVAYGMITSREGLCEVPHLAAPADAADLRRAMVSRSFDDIAAFPIRFIPGVKNMAGKADLSNFSQMDMMRGEETEAVGLWRLLMPASACLFLLPGSHNKLTRMDETGRIMGCMTTMSGEFLSVLTNHTILSSAVDHLFATAETYDRDMALAGFREAEKMGLGRAAFAGRILSTLGGLPPEKIASYLLGAVLSTDIQAIRAFCGSGLPLFIAGKQPLKQALADVAQAAGLSSAAAVADDLCARMGIAGALHIAGLAA